MRFAYADPPYLGKGHSMYGHLHDEAHIWDDHISHIDLLDRLMDEYPDGWAYSCLPRDLGWVLRHLPADDTRVGAWVKTYHQIRPTSVQYAWEPVVWRGGRVIKGRNPLIRDWHRSANHRGLKASFVPGAKPASFNRWVIDLLGYQDGDTLDDLFPGSGGMGAEVAAGVLQYQVEGI